MNKRQLVVAIALAMGLECAGQSAMAQDGGDSKAAPRLQQVDVKATVVQRQATASKADYQVKKADFGPLGTLPVKDQAKSVVVVPADFIVNQQSRGVNDILRYLPSVETRDQQGVEMTRVQSRGFQGSIVQNTRMDGLNVIGTTAIPAENLSGITVLNGMSGALYGPETPAGIFNYTLARPTDQQQIRLIEGYNSESTFTEEVDASGRAGNDNKWGYRLTMVHGEGGGYVTDSRNNRTLFSGAVDYHFDDNTVLETNFTHYRTYATGAAGEIVYGSGKSTILPAAVDPTTPGIGQPGAGADLTSSTAVTKLKHDFGNGWTFTIGGLYENAIRDIYGITNTLTNNAGAYKTTQGFNQVPRFTIVSNMAQLNGHFSVFGMQNDLSVGTNGFANGQYTNFNSIVTNLGSASLSHPVIYPPKALPPGGGQYLSSSVKQQSLVLGDTLHITDQLAVQGVVSASYLHTISYNAKGQVTTANLLHHVISPTASIIYKPTETLTAYATWSHSTEQGDQAPAGTANVNAFMAPYKDKQYEAGIKYAPTDRLLITFDGFRMTRPLAEANATTNIFAVVGEQRNTGAELFAQGDLTPSLSLFGGVTYIDASLQHAIIPGTNGKMVVGVPKVKSDITLDYHPEYLHGLAFSGTVHGESRRAATDTNNSFAPAYGTIDLGMRYATHFMQRGAAFRFQVINATNRFYYESIADGNIVGIPGANSAYLALPRTFMASYELDL